VPHEPFRTPYAGYDVLAKWDTPSWDEQTREVVRKRLTEVPTRHFFSEEEWQTLEAVCARLVPQPERSLPVPIVPWIDDKLHHNRGDGFRYEDMPPMRDAWRLGLQGIDAESHRRFAARFKSIAEPDQDAVLRAIQAGDVEGGVWTRLPAQRFFATVLLKEVVGEYYAHPAAWSEVGFGGPASPRGYVRLDENQRDPWEASERPRHDEHLEDD
jgi:hypothetical protein